MVDVAALKTAARAAIVIPAVFALADKVIQQPQTSLLAAFGSFAMLVLVEFGGPPRTRLLAYLGLGCVGALYVTLGTLCSRNSWLAAGAMAVVGFVTLFAGAFNGYFAAGATGAILTFVLPVTLSAPNSAIPDRLEGWGLAVGACTSAAMLLWPAHYRAELRAHAARAVRAVADFVAARGEQVAERARLARESVDDLGRRMLGGLHRPNGPAAPTAALASLPDELDWMLAFLTPSADRPPLELACGEDEQALLAAAGVLRASADRLEGGTEQPDIEGLDAARDAVVRALLRRLPELPTEAPGVIPQALDTPFRIRVLAYAAHHVASYALMASGAEGLDGQSPHGPAPRGWRARLAATRELVVEHARIGSVWFQNSVRGAAGLAIAVLIAQRTGLQHGFWVVLGTLSVLRSNALGTGWSVLSALAGTAVGIVVGAALILAIGTDQTVLWIVLPVAILLAAYAPRAISFAAGQAGFTVVLLILFNIIAPVGWTVGLVRVEDVAIGFAISLGVGVLFWPRGASALLRSNLSDAYARGVDLVVAIVHGLIDGGDASETARARSAGLLSSHLLDDAFRQYLTERSPKRFEVEDVGALVGGASRLRRSAESLAMLGHMAEGRPHLDRCGRNLDRELGSVQSWFLSLGYSLSNGRGVPAPHVRDQEGLADLLACLRDAAQGRDPGTLRAALVLLWTSQHLDGLWRLEAHLHALALRARTEAPPARALRRLRALTS